MSANVDERVVQMKFDNQQFETKAQNTITTLNSLSQALQLPFGNTKGLDQIQNAANRLDFSKLNQAIEIANYKFSMFGTMACEVMNRISTAAVNMGQKLVESVTTEPLKSGFNEYETKMDSVKRILNSAKNEDGTAVSLDQVNKRLDELNTYADKTIYNFMDMTENIGKFTNAGVDLDKSVLAIQGIANEAALAGAGTQEASRAMYNFAQALSAGSVKLIDWKSIENANMATVGFKEELIKTALELGTVKKKGDEYVTTTTGLGKKTSEAFTATTKFNESLSYQWMTSDVLIQTLAKYADETTELGQAAFKAATEVTTFSKLIDTLKEALGSGWTESWQIIIGDFDEAKQLWTAINNVLSDTINTTAEARNTTLEYWKEWGGRKAIIEGLGNAWHALMTVLKPVKRAFDDILNPFKNVTGAAVVITTLSKKFRDFTQGLILHYPIQRKIWVAAKGLFSVFDLLGQVVSAVWRTIQPIFSVLGDIFVAIAKRVVQSSSKFTEFVAKLKETDAIYKKLQEFVGVLKKVADAALSAGKAILEFFGVHIEVKEGADFIDVISAAFEAFASNPLVATGISILKTAKDAITNFFTGLQGIQIPQGITDAFTWIGNTLAIIGSTVKANVIEMFGQLGTELKEFFTTADGESIDFSKILDAGVLGLVFKKVYDILTGKNNPISIIKQFLEDLSNIQDVIDDVADALSDFVDTITGPLKALQMSIKADVLLKIAKAIAILAASLWVLSRIDADKMGAGLFGMAGIMGELTAAMAGLSKILGMTDAPKLAAMGPALIAFSVAIGILSLSVAGLAKLDAESLINGLLVVGSLMTLLAIMTRIGGSNLNTKGIVGMSIAIFILQASVKRLGEMDEDALAHGLQAVGLLLAAITLLSKFSGKSFSGVGMIAVAVAIRILQGAVITLGEIDEGALNRGVTAVSVLLLFLGLFSLVAGKKALGASVGAIALAYAMNILKEVVATFAEMDDAKLGQGIMAVGSSLLIMAIALNAMAGTLSGAAALYVAIKALNKLVPVIFGLAAIPFENILKSIAGLALAFGVLIVAGYMLGPVVATFTAFGTAVLLVGAGVLALGIGLTAAAAGVTALSLSMVAGTASVIASIGMILAAIIEAIPFVVMMIGAGLIGILKTIGDSAETIVQVVVQVGTAILNGLWDLMGPLAEFLVNAELFIMRFLRENLPVLITEFMNMTIEVIDGIALAIYDNTDRILAAIGHVVGAILNLLLATLQGIVEQIPGVGGRISKEIGKIREGMAEQLNMETGREMGKNLTDGVKQGVQEGTGDVEAASADAGEAGFNGFMSKLSRTPVEAKLVYAKDLPESVRAHLADIRNASAEYGEEGVAGMEEGFGDLSTLGLNLDEGLAGGMTDNLSLVADAGGEVGLSATDAIAAMAEIESPSKVTWEQGKYLDEGLANGMTENQGLITTAVTGLGSILTNGFNAVASVFTNAGIRNGTSYAQGLSRGVAPARSAGSSIATSASSALSALAHRFSQNGSESGALYASGVFNTSGQSRIAGSAVGTMAVTGLGTARPAFTVTGVASGTNYTSGVSSKRKAANQAGTSLGTSAAHGARNYKGFYDAGGDSSQGYLDGLLSKAKKIATAAADMVKNALDAARNAIDSHSPSQAYERLGEDSDQGYINGVEKRSGKVKSTLTTLAESSMGAFYEGLTRANEAANNELAVTPTIAPVMDMNNVYGGIDFLSDVFNGADSVLGNITADVSNNVEDIHELVTNTKQILTTLSGRRPITIDGKTVIGWIDVELGAL